MTATPRTPPHALTRQARLAIYLRSRGHDSAVIAARTGLRRARVDRIAPA